MSSGSYNPTKDPRTGRPPLPNTSETSSDAAAQSAAGDAERHAIDEVQRNAGDSSEGRRTVAPTPEGERPEALAQFSQSAREESTGKSPKDLVADGETAPIPTDNATKHDVASKLLNEGAHGNNPDPDAAGEDRLPDRIARNDRA